MCPPVASLAQQADGSTRANRLTWQAALDVISDRLTE